MDNTDLEALAGKLSHKMRKTIVESPNLHAEAYNWATAEALFRRGITTHVSYSAPFSETGLRLRSHLKGYDHGHG
jgi:hypothetical protein